MYTEEEKTSTELCTHENVTANRKYNVNGQTYQLILLKHQLMELYTKCYSESQYKYKVNSQSQREKRSGGLLPPLVELTNSAHTFNCKNVNCTRTK